MLNLQNCIKYGLLLSGIVLLSGCGSKEKELPTVPLSVWCDESNVELIKEELNTFQEMHKSEANFDFTVSVEGEDTCKEMVLTDPKGAADIFMFADDQFQALYQNHTLLKFTKYQDEIIDGVGGKESGAAQAALRNGDLYASPLTAGNGYFLYYNKEYLSDEDVKTIEGILEAAARAQKKFSMDYSSGWYIYSFFKGAGLNLNCEDGLTNECNWNATDTKFRGIDVAKAMANIANHDGFINCGDDGFVAGVEDGSVIAGINGAWNASKIEAAWGDNYAATMLPTYSLNGNQVQMCSFTGYKLMGINAYTEYPDYCMELVAFLTREEGQLKRFKLTGECPANKKAASSQEVQDSPAVAALALQSQYGYVQRVADPFWNAASKLGIILASGNRDNKNLQEILDKTVEEITTPAELITTE